MRKQILNDDTPSASSRTIERAGTALVVFFVVCHAACLQAGLVEVANSSFEDTSGNTVFNEFTFGPPPGWEFYDPNNLVINNGVGPQFWLGTLAPTPPTFFNTEAPHGERVAIAFNLVGTGGLGEYGLQQTLGDVLLPNTRYHLQVEIGNIASGTAVNGAFFNLDGFPGYRVDLLAGGAVLASDVDSLAGLIGEGAWGTSEVVFETDASHLLLGQSLGIRLVNLNRVDAAFPAADLEVDFDFVRLSATTVPEPSVFGVVVVAVGVLGSFRNRKKLRMEN